MENDYRITKLHGTFIGDNRIPDLPTGEKTKVFSSTNGKTAWVDLPEGGKSVSPCLNLMNFEDGSIRTSITEEEKTNLENGLYNSVIYHDESFGESGFYSVYFPEPMVNLDGNFMFSAYSVSNELLVTGSRVYTLTIGEKSSDGTYPITISKAIESFFGSAGGNGIETIETSVVTHNSDGSYTYLLPHTPTSNPYILKTVDSGESAYYLMTGDSEISFGMRPIALTDSFFGGNFMTVSGTTAIQRPTNFPPQPKSADNGKVLTVNNGYPSWETAGGASVSPTLILMDLETGDVRTSITEEEKTNLENGLYNSVLYMDGSSPADEFSLYFPECLSGLGYEIFTKFNVEFDEASNTTTIVGMSGYQMKLGEKGSDGNYPITIIKTLNASFGGGSGVDNYLIKDIVDDSVTLTNDEFKKLAESNCTLVLRSTRGHSIWYYISSLKVVSSENGAVSEIKVTAFTWISSGNISASDSYVLTFTPDSLTSNVTRTETSTSPAKLFNKFNVLTNDFTLTDILPCSTADNGKALSVVNGEAQWADLGTTYSKARYEHTITIKNSEGKILWTQTMRNSSNTVVNSYTNLKTLFGEAAYAGFGEYCQLDLRGGTEATDKLIKLDGTEATLASLGAIVYTDVCFLPK